MIQSRTVILSALIACTIGCIVASASVFADDDSPAPADSDDRSTDGEPLPLRDIIDFEIKKVWERDGVKPATKSSDSEFLRRIYLDVVGMQPTVQQTRDFLSDETKDKRKKLIETLLNDKRFGQTVADRWTMAWVGQAGSKTDAMIFGDWMATRINNGEGFDDIVYDVIIANGTILDNPGGFYYMASRKQNTADIAGEAVKHFTGVQLQCAQCHDHMYEEAWTMAEFDGVASFFAGTGVVQNGNSRPRMPKVITRTVSIVPADTMKARMDAMKDKSAAKAYYEKNRYRGPKYLLGKEIRVTNSVLWRKAWAKHATSNKNDQSNRYWANRLWSFVMGTGLYNPVDDFNSFNEASHPELLDILADEFRVQGHDIKAFYREILNSETYQLSSIAGTWGKKQPENWHFASYPVKQLNPNQFAGALFSVALQGDESRAMRISNVNPYAKDRQAALRYEKQKKAGELDKNKKVYTNDFEMIELLEARWARLDKAWVARRWLAASLSKNLADTTLKLNDTEFSMTLPQTLLRVNGKVSQILTSSGRGSVLEGIVKRHSTAEARIEELVLTMFCRYPEKAESERFVAFLKGRQNKKQGMEDLMYALLNTTEFTTIH